MSGPESSPPPGLVLYCIANVTNLLLLHSTVVPTGATSPISSSSPDLESRRARRDRRSKPWARHANTQLLPIPTPAESESAATETPCIPSVGTDESLLESSGSDESFAVSFDSFSLGSDESLPLSLDSPSVLSLPDTVSRIPAPRSSRAAVRRHVAYARASVTSATRTLVRALTPRQRESAPPRPAGRSRPVFCRFGLHKPVIQGKKLFKSARAKETMIHADGSSRPVLRSALKGGTSGRKAELSGQKVSFKCCPKVFYVESWKSEVDRDQWRKSEITPESEDEPDYTGLAWLDQE